MSGRFDNYKSHVRRMAPAFLVSVLVLIVLGVSSAATNSVTFSTGAIGEIGDHTATTFDPNDFKPAECASLILTVVANGSGTPVNGPDGGALVIGGDNSTVINGGAGDDCIVGGSGTTHINGGGGTNVCIGVTGTIFDANCQTTVTRS